jgi:tyrosyl-tRNA synthetase
MDSKQLFGLTAPLLTTSGGAKMGKTAGGAVWLNADMLSHFDFWQYWRNVADADVGRFLKIFTDLPLDEISKLEALKDQEINEAKKILADNVTALIRGIDVLDDIHKIASSFFGANKGSLDDIEAIAIKGDTLPIAIEDFCLHMKLFESKGEVRRFMQGGGLRVNDTVIQDSKTSITPDDFKMNDRLKISLGKKKQFLYVID